MGVTTPFLHVYLGKALRVRSLYDAARIGTKVLATAVAEAARDETILSAWWDCGSNDGLLDEEIMSLLVCFLKKLGKCRNRDAAVLLERAADPNGLHRNQQATRRGHNRTLASTAAGDGDGVTDSAAAPPAPKTTAQRLPHTDCIFCPGQKHWTQSCTVARAAAAAAAASHCAEKSQASKEAGPGKTPVQNEKQGKRGGRRK